MGASFTLSGGRAAPPPRPGWPQTQDPAPPPRPPGLHWCDTSPSPALAFPEGRLRCLELIRF